MTVVPDPTEYPTLSIVEGGSLLGYRSRAACYEGAKEFQRSHGTRGVPVIQMSEHRWRVPTASLLALLGLSASRDEAPAITPEPANTLHASPASTADPMGGRHG